MKEHGVVFLVTATTPKPWLDPVFRHAVRVEWERKVPSFVTPAGLRWAWVPVNGRLFFVTGAGWFE